LHNTHNTPVSPLRLPQHIVETSDYFSRQPALWYKLRATRLLYMADMHAYQSARGSFDEFIKNISPKCSFTDSPENSIIDMGNFYRDCLEYPESRENTILMGILIRDIAERLGSDNIQEITLARIDAATLSELVRCFYHRGQLIDAYYTVRPRLVEEGLVPSFEELESQGLSAPLSSYRIFHG